MKIQTLTVVVGNNSCDAKCPYCVSKMTPNYECNKIYPINYRNFNIACKLANKVGVTTVLITGKGEPTLFLDQVSTVVNESNKKGFPFIELQTNGLNIYENRHNPVFLSVLKSLYENGLTTISISIVHYDIDKNSYLIQREAKQVFNIWKTVELLHNIGFSVRIGCVLLKDYINDYESVNNLILKCKEYNVEQITLRNVDMPDNCDNSVSKWIKEHRSNTIINEIRNWLESNGAFLLLKLPFGANVYDLNGQNVCLTNCLTESSDPENIRQLIYFPDGHLRYSWSYPGAILL